MAAARVLFGSLDTVLEPFAPWLARWALVPDGAPFKTHTSRLLPVRHAGAPAILKLTHADEERRGGAVMEWYAGGGAARVLARAEEALLLERAEGANSLAHWARTGRDDDATRVLCRTVAALHVARPHPPPSVVPLPAWFGALARQEHPVLARAWAAARELLDSPRDVVVLHGDIHHENVLDGGARGWLAIDPKGLIGERAFDYANIFCNPDPWLVVSKGRLRRQAEIVAGEAGLDLNRLLRWILAYAGLSAAWNIEEGKDSQKPLRVAQIAAVELDTLD